MNPCVRTVLKGGAPFPASERSSEDWNHPRCWSLPSRYMSACHGCSLPFPWRSSARRISTAREEEPESIHTSRVSLDLLTASAPVHPLGFTSDQSSEADFSNQTLEPSFPNNSAAWRMIRESNMELPSASKNA